jgi:hypothetical protein
VYGHFLEEGSTWGRLHDGRPRPSGPCCDARTATHEAGHAVICADEGIKVQYVTGLAGAGWHGEGRLGFCQYDYNLPARLRADPGAWAEKVALATLGGPEAERIFWERRGEALPEDVRWGWADDRNRARDLIRQAREGPGEAGRDPAAQWARLQAPDITAEYERLSGLVRARLLQRQVWEVVQGVADQIRAEGAIDGRAVTAAVAQLRAG